MADTDAVVDATSSEPPRGRALIPYFVVTATLAMGYGSVFTLLAEIRNEFGFSESGLGVIAASGFLAGFVAQIVFAPQADRGRSALMVRAGILLAAVGMLGMVFATTLAGFIGSRVLFGLSSGAAAPAIRRLIILRDPENVGENLGKMSAYDIFGFVLGPILAAVVFEIAGLRAPFIIMAVANVALFFWVGRLDLDGGPASSEKRAFRPLLNIVGIQAALFAGVAFYITLGFWEATWALLLDDLGAETWMVGASLSAMTIPMIFLAPTGGRLTQKIGHRPVIIWSISVAALCSLLYGWVPSLWIVLAISLVHALADAFTMPANHVAMAVASPPDQLASAQGLYSATGTLVSGLVAVIAGVLYDVAGPETVFTTGAAAMMVFMGLSAWRSSAAASAE